MTKQNFRPLFNVVPSYPMSILFTMSFIDLVYFDYSGGPLRFLSLLAGIVLFLLLLSFMSLFLLSTSLPVVPFDCDEVEVAICANDDEEGVAVGADGGGADVPFIGARTTLLLLTDEDDNDDEGGDDIDLFTAAGRIGRVLVAREGF